MQRKPTARPSLIMYAGGSAPLQPPPPPSSPSPSPILTHPPSSSPTHLPPSPYSPSFVTSDSPSSYTHTSHPHSTPYHPHAPQSHPHTHPLPLSPSFSSFTTLPLHTLASIPSHHQCGGSGSVEFVSFPWIRICIRIKNGWIRNPDPYQMIENIK